MPWMQPEEKKSMSQFWPMENSSNCLRVPYVEPYSLLFYVFNVSGLESALTPKNFCFSQWAKMREKSNLHASGAPCYLFITISRPLQWTEERNWIFVFLKIKILKTNMDNFTFYLTSFIPHLCLLSPTIILMATLGKGESEYHILIYFISYDINSFLRVIMLVLLAIRWELKR